MRDADMAVIYSLTYTNVTKGITNIIEYIKNPISKYQLINLIPHMWLSNTVNFTRNLIIMSNYKEIEQKSIFILNLN